MWLWPLYSLVHTIVHDEWWLNNPIIYAVFIINIILVVFPFFGPLFCRGAGGMTDSVAPSPMGMIVGGGFENLGDFCFYFYHRHGSLLFASSLFVCGLSLLLCLKRGTSHKSDWLTLSCMVCMCWFDMFIVRNSVSTFIHSVHAVLSTVQKK